MRAAKAPMRAQVGLDGAGEQEASEAKAAGESPEVVPVLPNGIKDRTLRLPVGRPSRTER